MVLYSQLVCSACRKILTYPLGAISCKCRNCHRINPSLHMEIVCEHCETTLFLPVNTTTALCPCCFTITEIPIDKLPMIEEPVILEGEEDDDRDDRRNAKTIYVEHTGGNAAGKSKVSVATQIPLGPLPDADGHLEGDDDEEDGSHRGAGGGGRRAQSAGARRQSTGFFAGIISRFTGSGGGGGNARRHAVPGSGGNNTSGHPRDHQGRRHGGRTASPPAQPVARPARTWA